MQHIKVKSKFGKIYNTETGRRIILKDGASFLLVADKEVFAKDDPLNRLFSKDEILDNKHKEIEVRYTKDLKSYYKLFPAGTILDFRFGITSKKSEEEKIYYWFKLQLLEDLYLIKKTTHSQDAPPLLFKCKCEVFREEGGELEFFEPIYAQSLNQALAKTIAYYFANQRTAGGSVYNTIWHKHPDNTLERIRKEVTNLMIEIK